MYGSMGNVSLEMRSLHLLFGNPIGCPAEIFDRAIASGSCGMRANQCASIAAAMNLSHGLIERTLAMRGKWFKTKRDVPNSMIRRVVYINENCLKANISAQIRLLAGASGCDEQCV